MYLNHKSDMDCKGRLFNAFYYHTAFHLRIKNTVRYIHDSYNSLTFLSYLFCLGIWLCVGVGPTYGVVTINRVGSAYYAASTRSVIIANGGKLRTSNAQPPPPRRADE